MNYNYLYIMYYIVSLFILYFNVHIAEYIKYSQI